MQELATRGQGPVSIARELSAIHSLSVSPGTVRHWIVGDRRPQQRNIFKPGPSPALSYIIGANIGDGCDLAASSCVKLEVTDIDFARTYNTNMATLFSRNHPNKVLARRFKDNRMPMYVVKYASKQLAELLRLPLAELLKIAFAFPREFLRGFFDAEGHVDVSITKYLRLRVGVENSDRRLLLKVRQLLRELKVASIIERKRKAGTIKVIRDTAFVMRRTSYSVTNGKIADVKRFAAGIGFSIQRKTRKLEDALSLSETCEARTRPVVWKQLYSKKGGEWVRRESPSLNQSKSIKGDVKGPSTRAGRLVW